MTSETDHTLVDEEYTLDDVRDLWGDLGTVVDDPNVSLRSGPSAMPKSLSKLTNVKRRHVATIGEDASKADYELLQVLGKGGMGTVFRARQLDIDRIVALKLLKSEIAKNPEKREKFIAEAVITGNLDHPNIVPLYDLGLTRENELFYTMKELRGDSWRQSLPNLSESENLEILLKVCDAAGFAHSKGVIHRDFKPDNVMLGDFGEVVVTDWGLAASVGHGLGADKAEVLDENSGSAGTCSYMAPEMARCEHDRIGPKSDVYLLGGILYEIATGLRPHGGKTIIHCLTQAMSNEISKTEKKNELIQIALKAMETDPKNRFPDVKSFQLAIRRCRDHRESLILTSKAKRDLLKAKEDGDYESFNRARFALEEALKLWPKNSKAKRMLHRTILSHAHVAYRRNDYDLALSIIDLSKSANREFKNRVINKRESWRKRQIQFKTFRRFAWGSGLLAVAILLGASIWIYKERQEAVSQRDRAIQARRKSELQEKIANQERLKALEQKRIANQERSKALEQKRIANQERSKAIKQEEIAKNEAKRAKTTSNFLLTTLSQADPSGKGGKGITVLQVMEKMSKSIPKIYKDDSLSQLNLHSIIAKIFRKLGRYDEAKRHLRAAKKLAEDSFGKKHPQYVEIIGQFIVLFLEKGDHEKAKSSALEALGHIEQSLEKNTELHAYILSNLGCVCLRNEEYAEAKSFYLKALKIIERNAGENHPHYALILNNLAVLHNSLNEPQKACEVAEKALKITKKKCGENHSHYVKNLVTLATMYRSQKKYSEAESRYYKALEIQKNLLKKKHPNYAVNLTLLGGMYYESGNYSKAETIFREAMEIRKNVLGENHPKYAESLTHIACIYSNQNKFEKAEPLFRKSLEIFEKTLGKKHYLSIETAKELILIRRKLKEQINRSLAK